MKISVSCFIRPSGQLNSAQTSNFQTFLVNLLRPYSIASLQETSLRFSFETIKSHLVPQRYSLHSYRIKCAEEYIDWESSLAKKAKISRKAGWSNPRPTAPQSISLQFSFCLLVQSTPFIADTESVIECFHMTSRRPCWSPKTKKRRPCWCPKPVLWELNSFLMQTLSFVPINLHRYWPRE